MARFGIITIIVTGA